jgi:hypothetical protein
LLWGLSLFLVSQVALAVAIERWLPVLRDADYAFRLERLRERLHDSSTRPTSVVVIGSSRTMFAVHGQLIEQKLSEQLSEPPVVFNLGFPGAGPLRHWLHLHRMLRDGVRPDVLLIEIMPYLLHTDTGVPIDFEQLSADKLRLSELRLLRREGLRCDSLREDWWLGWPFPAYTHRFALVSMTIPTLLPCPLRQDYGRGIDASGWTPMSKLFLLNSEQRQRALKRACDDHGPALQDFRLCATSSRVLQEMLDVSRREGIRAALLVMPEGPIYRGLYSPATWTTVDEYLHMISDQFHVPLINAREWLAEDDFWDSHHMTREGAMRFSARLSEDILPLLRGNLVGGNFRPHGS